MSPMRWQSVVDFLVLAGAIYLVLRWGKEARALRIALAIVGLRAAALLTRQLGLLVTSWVLDVANVIALVLILIVFQTELRHALARLDVIAWLLPRRETTPDQAIQSISSAVFSLAQARRGALIVMAGRDSVAEFADGGVPLGGAISPEILEAIFRKVSPVHDGATIVEGDHIARVSAILPITRRTDLPTAYGMRHRAALGLAERCDALVIVVSEERGEVSLVYGRMIRTIDMPGALVRAIRELRATPPAGFKRALGRILFGDLGLKGAAVGLAALLWSASFWLPGSSIRSVTVPVEFTNVPRNLEVSQLSPNTVQVQLRGSSWIFDSVNLNTVVARFDLSGAGEGHHALPVERASLGLPPGLIIEHVSPRTVSLRLAQGLPQPPRP